MKPSVGVVGERVVRRARDRDAPALRVGDAPELGHQLVALARLADRVAGDERRARRPRGRRGTTGRWRRRSSSCRGAARSTRGCPRRAPARARPRARGPLVLRRDAGSGRSQSQSARIASAADHEQQRLLDALREGVVVVGVHECRTGRQTASAAPTWTSGRIVAGSPGATNCRRARSSAIEQDAGAPSTPRSRGPSRGARPRRPRRPRPPATRRGACGARARARARPSRARARARACGQRRDAGRQDAADEVDAVGHLRRQRRDDREQACGGGEPGQENGCRRAAHDPTVAGPESGG